MALVALVVRGLMVVKDPPADLGVPGAPVALVDPVGLVVEVALASMGVRLYQIRGNCYLSDQTMWILDVVCVAWS